jgi:DNA-binding MarR family transcriptional regulator
MKDKAELVKQIIELQRQVRRALRQYVPDAWMNLNLTIAQLKSLFLIAREGSMNTKSLAEALGVTSSNVTGIVDRLVKQGLVSRQENPEDRRMLQIQVTDQGQAILTSLREETISSMSEVLARMSVEELSSLSRGLSALVKAAEAHEREIGYEHD